MNKQNRNRIILVVVMIIIIVGLVLISHNKKTTYFEKVTVPTDNEVYNRTNHSYMDTIILIGLDELNIKGVAVLITPLTIPVNGIEGIEINAFIRRYSSTKYLIEIGEFSRSMVMDILSHELLHLHQYHTQRLQINSTSIKWYDRVYIDDIPTYFKRPWEIEAEGLGRILEVKIKSRLYKDVE